MRNPLDIRPRHFVGNDCYEDQIASIVAWCHNNTSADTTFIYFCYLNAWDFIYNTQDKRNSITLGKKLSSEFKDSNPSLRKYYGVDVQHHSVNDFYEFLNVVRCEVIHSRNPLIIFLKPAFIPWDYNYNRHDLEYKHAFIIVGMDEKNQQFLATDGYYSKMNETISFNNVEVGMSKKFLLIKSCDDYSKLSFDNWKQAYQYIILNMNRKIFDKSIFSDMKIFAEDIEQLENLKDEIENDSIVSSALYTNLTHLMQGRRKFSSLLKWFYITYGLDLFDFLCGEMNTAANKWHNIQLMFVKFSRKPQNHTIRHKISDSIRDAARYESGIVDQLMNILKEPEKSIGKYQSQLYPSFSHIDYIDLSKVFNNKGIGSPSITSTANIVSDPNLPNMFFEDDGMPDNQIVEIMNMKYKFPQISDDFYDNISCRGEEISFGQLSCDSIMILGCAEYGDFVEALIIYYCDDKTETLEITFSDWSKHPLFGEKIAFGGKIVYIHDRSFDFLEYDHYIYTKTYFLKTRGKIDKIKLPVCPNIHIFAISLGLLNAD